MKENKRLIVALDCVFIILAGMMYFAWSLHLMQSWAPDEGMRGAVGLWIAEHGTLPFGNEPELINEIWGFSYAFLPYLTSLIGAGIIKITSLFTTDMIALYLAQRLVSVIAGMGTAFFALKIGKRVFRNRISDYLFASFICLLPQFVFLCSYFNNDSFSVFTTVVILYFWILGLQDGWNIKNTIGLGIGIGMCALTYYNAYGYILCSILIYVFSWIKKGEKFRTKEFFKYGLMIAFVAIAFAGWYFLRNAILYDGDFLGLQTTRACGEIHAMEEYKPSNRSTLYNQGLPITALLLNRSWVFGVLASFVGSFRYLDVTISHTYIVIYYVILVAGAVIGLIQMIHKKNTRLLSITMIGTIIIPCCLIVYSSYAADYQPQGRYIISALPAAALFASNGYDKLLGNKEKWKQNLLLGCVWAVWIILFALTFKNYIYPYCWCLDRQQLLN